MVDLPITKWIKKKIRRLIGIVEDTDVATHSIASGKYVVWKGDLCKSTAPIAVGGSLSLSNLSPVSDGGLNELSGQIASLGTISTVTPTASVAMTNNTTIKKVGKLVTANISFIPSSLQTQTTTLMTGFPKPAQTLDAIMVRNQSDGSMKRLRLTTGGALTAYYSDLAAGIEECGVLTYIANK